jgi:hypothetical protein
VFDLYLRESFGVYENLINLLLFLELAVFLSLSTKRLFPRLGSLRVAPCQFDDSLDLLNFFPHAGVQLHFHCVQVIVDVLSEADKERQRLLDATCLGKMVASREL